MSLAVHDERSAPHAYPADLTFQDLIRRNRRNSKFLVLGMMVLVVALAVAIASAAMVYGAGVITWQGLAFAAVAGLVVILLASTWSYFAGASAILAISGARPLAKEEDPELFNVVDELRIAGGLPMPAVYLIDDEAMNAFATGRSPQRAAVAITRGLREKLSRDELSGVMAHELSHVRHLDIRLTMLVATLVGLIVLACDVFLRAAFRGGRYSGRARGRGGGVGILILLVVALLLSIIAPILARLIQFAVSRQREYLADAGAVELTRYPQGLADALRKLSGDPGVLESANRATAHLYIVNPLLKAAGRLDVNTVFSTHPPIGERIARLEALMR